MSFVFTSRSVVRAAEAMINECLDHDACASASATAEKLAQRHEQDGDSRQAAFYRLVERYCFYVEFAGAEDASRYKRVMQAGRLCTWPSFTFTPVDGTKLAVACFSELDDSLPF